MFWFPFRFLFFFVCLLLSFVWRPFVGGDEKIEIRWRERRVEESQFDCCSNYLIWRRPPWSRSHNHRSRPLVSSNVIQFILESSKSIRKGMADHIAPTKTKQTAGDVASQGHRCAGTEMTSGRLEHFRWNIYKLRNVSEFMPISTTDGEP